MNLSETKKILNAKSRESKKKKYPGDAADYSFRVHVLKLLQKIAGKKDELKEFIPQEAGYRDFHCKTCDGEGYIERYDMVKKKESKIIEDCAVCGGKGTVVIEVIDRREKNGYETAILQ